MSVMDEPCSEKICLSVLHPVMNQTRLENLVIEQNIFYYLGIKQQRPGLCRD